jgi:broad specificity phosphatase PhoE
MPKELLLIRHGRVDAEFDTPLKAEEMPRWIDDYNRAPLHPESRPSEALKRRIARTGLLLVSSLPRTADSARRLGREPDRFEPLLDEAEVAELPIPLLRLRPWSWLKVARVMMTLGYRDRRGVSLAKSRRRAREAATMLEGFFETRESVAVVGHGGMNWLIARQLRRRGWRQREASHENWGVTLLER